jgi:hypothetical protein
MRKTSLSAVLLSSAIVLAACSHTAVTKVATAPSKQSTLAMPPGSKQPWKVLTYGSARFQVPATWPVYDLAASPGRCVRFDQHAVYLGREGPGAACPARVLGKTEAVQVEPLDSQTTQRLIGNAMTRQLNGQVVTIQPFSDTAHNLIVSFNRLGLLITVTYGRDRSLAEQVVQSVKQR